MSAQKPPVTCRTNLTLLLQTVEASMLHPELFKERITETDEVVRPKWREAKTWTLVFLAGVAINV